MYVCYRCAKVKIWYTVYGHPSHTGSPYESGWWCNNHLEKYEFVNGKDDIPYIMENKIHVPNHQPDTVFWLPWLNCLNVHQETVHAKLWNRHPGHDLHFVFGSWVPVM